MRDTSWKIYQLVIARLGSKGKLKPHVTAKGENLQCIHNIALTNYNLTLDERSISWSTWQNSMSVYGYIAEKGLLKGKTEQQLPIRNPILALEGTDLPYAAKTGSISLKLTQDKTQCFLPPLSGNSSDAVLCRTVEQCQHQPEIQVNSRQFRSCSSEGSSGM